MGVVVGSVVQSLLSCIPTNLQERAMSSFTPNAGAHADLVAVAMGIIFTFVVFLFVITSTAAGYYLIRKTMLSKKAVPVVVLS